MANLQLMYNNCTIVKHLNTISRYVTVTTKIHILWSLIYCPWCDKITHCILRHFREILKVEPNDTRGYFIQNPARSCKQNLSSLSLYIFELIWKKWNNKLMYIMTMTMTMTNFYLLFRHHSICFSIFSILFTQF